MLLPSIFLARQVFHASNFASLCRLCESLRSKDSKTPYTIELEEGESEGNFAFPYSYFCIRSKRHVLRGHLFAKQIDSEGKELTTWRTATLKVTGDHNLFEGLDILNDAGVPLERGQEVALGVYGDDNVFISCHFQSTQDTLFSGPLPQELETRYRGFLPDEERFHQGGARNYYLDCIIEGTVDFIFGAGDAVFYEDKIISFNDGRDEYYVSAPATERENPFGYLFHRCFFLGREIDEQSVYLARPWRDYGKAVFSSCVYGSHIKKEGFAEWNNLERKKTCRFEEYPLQKGRVQWTHNSPEENLPSFYENVLFELKGYRLK